MVNHLENPSLNMPHIGTTHPFPSSSPTDSSVSTSNTANTTNSSWSSAATESSVLGHGATITQPRLSVSQTEVLGDDPHRVTSHGNGKDDNFHDKKTLAGIGHGWRSSTSSLTARRAASNMNQKSSSFLRGAANDFVPPPALRRSRSPSVPFLPSDDTRHDNWETGSSGDLVQPFEASHFEPPRKSDNTLSFKSSARSITDSSSLNGVVGLRYQPSLSLLHHRSMATVSDKSSGVPITPVTPGYHSLRRDSVQSVRWADQLLDDADEPYGTIGQPTLSYSQSMPLIGKGRNLYLPQIAPDLTEEALRNISSKYGRILSTRVDRDISRPRAFVLFEQPNDARAFKDALAQEGTPCEYAKEDFHTEYKAAEDPHSSNLYVQGILATEAGKDDLKRLFAETPGCPARIVSDNHPMDGQGNRRDIIMARVESRNQADAVIAYWNGKPHPRTGQMLTVRIADSPEQKRLKQQRNKHSSPTFGGCFRQDSVAATAVLPSVSTVDLKQEHEALMDRIAQIEREMALASLQHATAPGLRTESFPAANSRPGPSPTTNYGHQPPSPIVSSDRGSAPVHTFGKWSARGRLASGNYAPWSNSLGEDSSYSVLTLPDVDDRSRQFQNQLWPSRD